MNVKIKKLHEDAVIPTYAKRGDAGMDLTSISCEIDKYGNMVYGTGLAIEIPENHVGLIFPRSGVSKYTLDLANSVGVIDSGYRGEIICKFKPTAQFTQSWDPTVDFVEPKTIYNEKFKVGDRVAQIVVLPIPSITFEEIKDAEELSVTERGENGFGSTDWLGMTDLGNPKIDK
jgi:dUTP pyrophosphatase